MESNINGDALLLGEANFSFSLSLAQSYCDPKHITATCYESMEDAKKKYGNDFVETNVGKLLDLNCKRVLFQIDACKLDEHFENEKFAHIIFMFPHVSGRSNLKKNRELIDRFFSSAKRVMQSDSCIYIALAKGQGGTSFEENPDKRNNKDSWQILQLAAKNGLILTQCYEYDQTKFESYTSTGFRNQSKSFATQSGLVHKFELSLLISLVPSISISNFKKGFLEKSDFFIQNNASSNLSTIHPINQISQTIAKSLFQSTNIELNLIHDELKFNLTHSESNQYIVDSSLVKYFQIDLPTNQQYFLRSSLLDSLNFLNKVNNSLNVISGLVVNNRNFSSFQTIKQLNNINHETLIHFSSSDQNFFTLSQTIRTSIATILKNILYKIKINQIGDLITIESSNNQVEHLACININLNRQELTAVINTSLLATVLFGLEDKRLLYSDDERNFILSSIEDSIGLTRIIKPFSIENVKWFHDISFWYDPDEFNYAQFIDTINETCLNLVKSVRMLEKYEEIGAENSKRYAICFRLEYESCDKALSWNDSVQLQYSLRDKIKLFNKIILR
jgi:hypothetical protein